MVCWTHAARAQCVLPPLLLAFGAEVWLGACAWVRGQLAYILLATKARMPLLWVAWSREGGFGGGGGGGVCQEPASPCSSAV